MLFRFSLYGFLKNQRYFDPFFILAFQEKGFSFFVIGLLIGFREVCIHLMTVPTGVLADLYGRRKSMVCSFVAYIISFVLFAWAEHWAWILLAMFFFSVGDSFRSGTHKSMIFEWLRQQGRLEERTKVYGFTRSWSKLGSALCVVIAMLLIFYTGSYSSIFLYSIIPYGLNILNCLSYPKSLDVEMTDPSVRKAFQFLGESFRFVWNQRGMRRIYTESMGFEVTYEVTKNYLQPILKQAALLAPVFLIGFAEHERTAILIGAVYVCLHLCESGASRISHVMVAQSGGELKASTVLWRMNLALFIVLGILLVTSHYIAASVCFIGLSVLQNLWRPALMSRIDQYSSPEMGSTILSIESQLKTLSVAIAAPVMGFVVDLWGFWPLAPLGIFVSIAILLTVEKEKLVAAKSNVMAETGKQSAK
jgi:MFS family permease